MPRVSPGGGYTPRVPSKADCGLREQGCQTFPTWPERPPLPAQAWRPSRLSCVSGPENRLGQVGRTYFSLVSKTGWGGWGQTGPEKPSETRICSVRKGMPSFQGPRAARGKGPCVPSGSWPTGCSLSLDSAPAGRNLDSHKYGMGERLESERCVHPPAS